jgi:hypothetical protein
MSVVASPNPAVGDTHLRGVACPTTTSCFAVGYNFVDGFPTGTASTWVERWNGTSWSNVASPNLTFVVSTLMGVSCANTATCFAVGEYGDSLRDTLVERWSGVAWLVVPVSGAGFPSSFNGVKCPSATFCFAVGHGSSAPLGGSNTALIERWNGTSWTILVNGNP